MGWFWAKAPAAVHELNDEQAVRWREGGQSVWTEDAKGRSQPPRAIARRGREASRTPAELAAQVGFPDPQAGLEAEVG